MLNQDYGFLWDTFREFQAKILPNPPQVRGVDLVSGDGKWKMDNPLLLDAARKTGLPPEMLFNVYVKPFISLEYFEPRIPPSSYKAIAELLTGYSAGLEPTFNILGLYTRCVYKIEPVDKSKDYQHLQWLMVWITDLLIRGMESGPRGDIRLYPMPYRQCRYCGRQNKDKRDKVFDARNKCCHVPGCITSSNPSDKDHEDGCCFKIWRRRYKAVAQHLKRAEARGADQQEIRDFFLQLCINSWDEIKRINPPPIRDEYTYKNQSSFSASGTKVERKAIL